MKENKWIIVVCGVLRRNNQHLIVQRRSDDEISAGFWEFPSGKVKFGEKVEDALRREIKEETGYDISNDSRRMIGISEYVIEEAAENRHTVQLNYLVDLSVMPQIKLSEEHVNFAWIEAGDDHLDEFLMAILKEINHDRI